MQNRSPMVRCSQTRIILHLDAALLPHTHYVHIYNKTHNMVNAKHAIYRFVHNIFPQPIANDSIRKTSELSQNKWKTETQTTNPNNTADDKCKIVVLSG